MGERYKTGTDKQQMSLLPTSLDEYVSENHICRVIDTFTKLLDLSELGFKYARYKGTGCPPYDPRMMLNLYLYGYLHRVRSSRRLEAETKRNVEVMWLMDKLQPDDRTICYFRADNKTALKKVFREFVRMCRKLGLYGGEVEATDGTKFRANASRKSIYNKANVEKELTEIDKQIDEYLNTLDQWDKEEKNEKKPDTAAIAAALEHLRERKEKYERLKIRVTDENGKSVELSTIDPDARIMHSGGDGRKLDACYNAQTIVDSKNKLIVDFDISDRADDKGNLYSMSEKAKEVLEVETLTNLADKGYYDGEDIAACEEDGVTCLVAKPKPGGTKKEEGFTHDSFIYEKENDSYICPCKNRLNYMRNHKHSNGKEYRVYANYSACGNCPRQAKCTKSGKREILRLPYQDTLDTVDERTRNNKELYRRRQQIVEHPFGTVKAVWGYKQYLCRGKEKITAETALAYLAYNMRRFITIFTELKQNPAMVLGKIT